MKMKCLHTKYMYPFPIVSQIVKRGQLEFFPLKGTKKEKEKEKQSAEKRIANKVGGNSRPLIGGTVCVRNRP